jgi:Tfp pilus assembly protein PilV
MTNTRDRKKKQSGTSMVEILVALTLFATFITGASKAIMAHRQTADKTRAHYTAINIAKNQIEQVREMRRASFTQIQNLSESNLRVDENGVPNETSGRFQRSTTITEVTPDILFEVEVVVQIQNPITLQFGSEEEHVKSYIAHIRESRY